MRLPVRLFLDLKSRSPDGSGTMVLDLEEGETVASALRRLGIASDPPKVILLDGRQARLDTPISDGQELAVFPPLDGG
jgi:molybdopterin converting factor small subunit